MSDDLTRRIEAIIRDGLWFEIKGDNPATAIGQIACAIASLIAEDRASARREALEEAARWHDEIADAAEDGARTASTPGLLAVYQATAANHRTAAAAIRSLATKEATNGQ